MRANLDTSNLKSGKKDAVAMKPTAQFAVMFLGVGHGVRSDWFL